MAFRHTRALSGNAHFISLTFTLAPVTAIHTAAVGALAYNERPVAASLPSFKLSGSWRQRSRWLHAGTRAGDITSRRVTTRHRDSFWALRCCSRQLAASRDARYSLLDINAMSSSRVFINARALSYGFAPVWRSTYGIGGALLAGAFELLRRARTEDTTRRARVRRACFRCL